jgi:hypothetical protein
MDDISKEDKERLEKYINNHSQGTVHGNYSFSEYLIDVIIFYVFKKVIPRITIIFNGKPKKKPRPRTNGNNIPQRP